MPSYRVEVREVLDSVRVTVSLPSGVTEVRMDSIQASHLGLGWATHLGPITARQRGRPLSVDSTGPARWRLSGAGSGEIILRYAVGLDFARVAWPAGNEQAGAVLSDALYLVGRALFIDPVWPGQRAVEFALPSGWQVSVPWHPRDASGLRFDAADATALVRNPLVVGTHRRIRIATAGLQLELALPGETSRGAALIEPALRRVLDGYLRLFPGTPPGRYLMTFFRAAADDGEGFTDGGSFTTSEPVTERGLIIWGNFLAHELMHYWNGQRIRGAGPRSEWRWMAEGFTEYYANVMLVRTGVIPADLFLRKVERHLGNYLYFATSPGLERVTLRDAGQSTARHRFGAYDGGWTVALCLDGLIRERSGDRRSLDDVMGALWAVARGGDGGYTPRTLDSLARAFGAVDSGSFVEQHVATSAVMPVAECLARFGLAGAFKGYAAEAFVVIDPEAPEPVRRRRAAWSGIP